MTDFTEGEGVETTPGNPAGFIAYNVSIGTSARQALSDWRDLGGTAGDAAWYRMYGQITDTLLRTEAQAALDPSTLPSASDYGEWAMGQGGQYASQVKVIVTDTETGEQTLLDYTHVTDEPHTIDEAIAYAEADYGDADTLDAYGQELQGAFVTHIWTTTPWNG